MTCPYHHWVFLPLELRRHLRGLFAYQFSRDRLAHLADHPRCSACNQETS